MTEAIVITPVKDSIVTSLKTIMSIHEAKTKIHHIVYNDFSSPETLQLLRDNAAKFSFELINLCDKIDTPSPNYDFVLQDGQRRALKEGKHLIVVESDVVVKENTLDELIHYANQEANTGMVGAITVDKLEQVNFPYLKFKNRRLDIIDTKRSLSFCCTLMSNSFLQKFNFKELDKSKDWYDTSLSKKAIDLGFKNIVLGNVTVLHLPHGSRPWKQLKYKNPVKYYFHKFWKGIDKI